MFHSREWGVVMLLRCVCFVAMNIHQFSFHHFVLRSLVCTPHSPLTQYVSSNWHLFWCRSHLDIFLTDSHLLLNLEAEKCHSLTSETSDLRWMAEIRVILMFCLNENRVELWIFHNSLELSACANVVNWFVQASPIWCRDISKFFTKRRRDVSLTSHAVNFVWYRIFTQQ